MAPTFRRLLGDRNIQQIDGSAYINIPVEAVERHGFPADGELSAFYDHTADELVFRPPSEECDS